MPAQAELPSGWNHGKLKEEWFRNPDSGLLVSGHRQWWDLRTREGPQGHGDCSTKWKQPNTSEIAHTTKSR